MGATNIFGVVAINPAAEQSLPTLPEPGNLIAEAVWAAASYETVRSRDFGNQADIGEDSWSLSIEERMEKVKAPISHVACEYVSLGSDIAPIEVKIYDVGSNVFALGSNVTVTSQTGPLPNLITKADTFIYRSVAIEIIGIGVIEIPRALVIFPTMFDGSAVEGGAVQSTIQIMPTKVQVLDPADYPDGTRYNEYQVTP